MNEVSEYIERIVDADEKVVYSYTTREKEIWMG